jgi:hypothetical protein
MISFKNEKIPMTFLILLIMCCLNTSLCAVAAQELNQNDKVQEILNHLVFTGHESVTARKWETYLKESTWFDDTEHQMAVIQPGFEFAAAVSSLSDCISNIENNESIYSSEWIKDFNKQFNAEYISKNFDSVKFIISCIHARNNLKYCEEQKKEALYREIIYRQAFEDYMRHLQSFSETLDTREQKKIVDRLTVAKTYLTGPPYPLQILLSSGRERLFAIAIKTRKELDPRLITFFSTHPLFKKPFNPIKAVKDLETLMENDRS